jgi:hypothetical protein
LNSNSINQKQITGLAPQRLAKSQRREWPVIAGTEAEMKKNWVSTNSDTPSVSGAQGSGGDESALFSLSTLKAKAETSGPTGRARDDNSGLIDLKALMEKAEREDAMSAAATLHVASHIPVYPFGPPVEATPAAQAPSVEAVAVSLPPVRRSRPRLLGAAAIACAILGVSAAAAAAVNAGIISFGTVRAAQDAQAHTALQWAIASSLVEPAPEFAQAAETQAAPTAQEPAAPSSPKETRPAKAFPHVAQAPVMNRPRAAAKEAPAKASPKTPANDPCKGDLMCAMQRAVKK